MPDFQQFAVTRESAANINVPTHSFVARVTDSTSGTTLADYTGPNAIQWPGVLATLTSEQQDEIAQNLAQQIILMKAGL